MALTLSIVDNADGTATATIAGADAATVTVYTMRANATAWTSSGSRIGNGTVLLTLTVGYYFAHAVGTVSGSPAISTVANLFAVTTNDDAVENRILDAVVSGIQAITPTSLSGLAASDVKKLQAIPLDVVAAGLNLPCIIVSPTAAETVGQGTNLRDDWGKPAVVSICDRRPVMDGSKLDKYLIWRERIIRYFATQRLSGVDEVIGCTVEPATIIDPKLGMYQFLVSGFTLRFRTREQRGV